MSELLTIAVAVLSGALAAALVLLLRLQGQMRPAASETAMPAPPPETVPPTASPPAEISPLALAPALGKLLAPDDVFMASVPGEPDLAIVQCSPEALRAVGKFEVIGAVPHEMLRSAVGADALVRAGIALSEGAGTLVRLTPESAAKFRELATMRDASGAFMGVLKGSNGQFAHVLRFTPATGMVALSGISSGLAAIAIQAQLTSIERAIADVGVDVRRILKTMELDAAAESAAITSLLGETYRAATSAGKLTETMWEQVAPLVFLVQKRVEYVDRRLAMLIDELAHQSGLKEKRRWLERNGQDLLDAFDAVQHHGRLSAQMAALRLWRLVLIEDPSTPFYVEQLREMVPARAQTVGRLGQEVHQVLAHTGETSRWQQRISPWDTRALADLSSRIRGEIAQSASLAIPGQGDGGAPASLPDHLSGPTRDQSARSDRAREDLVLPE